MLTHCIPSKTSIIDLDHIRSIIFLGHQSSLRLQLTDLFALDIFGIVCFFIDHNSHLEVDSLLVSDVVLMGIQDLFESGIPILVFNIDGVGIDLNYEVIEGPVILNTIILEQSIISLDL